jgi:protein-S-isoprenylcysteine O-methyltransferase Ste14
MPPASNTASLARRLAGAVAFVAFFAALLFLPAATIEWPRAWVLLTVLLVIRVWGTIVVFRAQPELLVERSRLVREGQPPVDRVLLTAFMATYAALVVFNGLDARRLKLLGAPPPPLPAVGLLLFAGGSIVVTLVLRENAFASAVVRYQEERGHSVVTTGPYRIVRHPMYAGLAASMLGMGLWLGSWAAAAASFVPTGILAARILLEERLLLRSLHGYADYAARVRSRLVPGVW